MVVTQVHGQAERVSVRRHLNFLLLSVSFSEGKPTKSRTDSASFRASAMLVLWGLPNSAPTMTLSSAVRSGNDTAIWNVFAIPSLHIWFALRPVMSCPHKVIFPAVGVLIPEIMLRSVVFPAPFGPTSPTISFSPSERSTSLTAISPPIFLVIPETTSMRTPERRLLCHMLARSIIKDNGNSHAKKRVGRPCTQYAVIQKSPWSLISHQMENRALSTNNSTPDSAGGYG